MKNIEVVLKNKNTYIITEEQICYWSMLYPDINVEHEIDFLKKMWEVKAFPRKSENNINKFINKWLYDESKHEY